eukprot:m.26286 g.26286  ORF g.26286 m.26286 type:complete len:97 (+) comp13300_c0_seq2:791-1081(+)
MPLRGKKGSLFDGGIRGAAFVWGAMIPAARRGTEYDGLIHVTDWLPSLLTLAAGAQWTPTYVFSGGDAACTCEWAFRIDLRRGAVLGRLWMHPMHA